MGATANDVPWEKLPVVATPFSRTLNVGAKDVSKVCPSPSRSVKVRLVRLKKSDTSSTIVYSRVSPGVSPAGGVSVTMATDFLMGAALAVMVASVSGPSSVMVTFGVLESASSSNSADALPSFTMGRAPGEVGPSTGTPPASRLGTKTVKMMVRSVDTVPQLSSRVPPGTEVLGSWTCEQPAASISAWNCSVGGRTSRTITFSTDSPGATITASDTVRGKFGPVAVSSSGAAMDFSTLKTVGMTVRSCLPPTMGASVPGSSVPSAPRLKIGITPIWSGLPTLVVGDPASVKLRSMQSGIRSVPTEPTG